VCSVNWIYVAFSSSIFFSSDFLPLRDYFLILVSASEQTSNNVDAILIFFFLENFSDLTK